MRPLLRSPRARPDAGIAILTVLLVLLALLVLAAPFLMTTRNAARASARLIAVVDLPTPPLPVITTRKSSGRAFFSSPGPW